MPSDIDVILVAPKGSGRTVRTLFKAGKGINSCFAVWQDVTGHAKEKATALGVAIGVYLALTYFVSSPNLLWKDLVISMRQPSREKFTLTSTVNAVA